MEASFNNLGSITAIESLDFVSPERPVYIIAFEDHSKTNPTCRELDASATIVIESVKVTEENSCIVFRKSMENLELLCEFCFQRDLIEFRISVLGDYLPNCRFGLVFPIVQNISSLDKEVCTPVSNFFNVFKQVFRDQQNLDLPLIRSGDQIFAGKETCNYQFFHYKSELSNLRVTCNTSHDSVMHLAFVPSGVSEAETYQLINPDSNFFRQHQKFIEKFRANFDVTVKVFQGSRMEYQVASKSFNVESPDPMRLRDFYHILEFELKKYDRSALASIGLNGIYLCSNLVEVSDSMTRKVVGAVTAQLEGSETWMFFDVATAQPWTIHHEIFHLIERKVECSEFPIGNRFLFRDYFGHDYVDSDSYTLEEFRADLFGAMMANSFSLKQLGKSDKTLSNQLDYLRNVTKYFVRWDDIIKVHDDRCVFVFSKNKQSFDQIPFLQLDYAGDLVLSKPDLENANNWTP